MKGIFSYHADVIQNFSLFSRSFTKINADDIRAVVDGEYAERRYWPPELIQINPAYRKTSTVDELIHDGTLHPLCGNIFKGFRLYKHQEEALAIAKQWAPYIVSAIPNGYAGHGKSK